MNMRIRHLAARILGHRGVKVAVIAGLLWIAYTQIWQAPLPSATTGQTGRLTRAEEDYYRISFAYAMQTLASGGSYDWKTYAAHGTIIAEDQFVSPSGASCRRFLERYTIGPVSGAARGVGCQHENGDGWCKLRLENAYTCALEPPETRLGYTLRRTSEWINRTGTRVQGTIDFW